MGAMQSLSKECVSNLKSRAATRRYGKIKNLHKSHPHERDFCILLVSVAESTKGPRQGI